MTKKRRISKIAEIIDAIRNHDHKGPITIRLFLIAILAISFIAMGFFQLIKKWDGHIPTVIHIGDSNTHIGKSDKQDESKDDKPATKIGKK